MTRNRQSRRNPERPVGSKSTPNLKSATIKIAGEFDVELWNQCGALVMEHFDPPTLQQAYTVAATLIHLAASSWGQFIPPAGTPRELLGEEAFLSLARNVFEHAKSQHQA